MTAGRRCSPGNAADNPHADQPNWRPASTFEEYAANRREGLETYSDTRAAQLLGRSRTAIWRWKLMAAIPEALFEKLLTDPDYVPSEKALAQVGQVFAGGAASPEVERCPHCAGVLRIRAPVSSGCAAIMRRWLSEQEEGQG